MSLVESDCKWHFAPQLGGREDGPNDPMSESFKKTPYASLIRESIQNSLDVPLDKSQPVKMDFAISSIDPRNFSNFFDLRNHIKGCIDYYTNNDDAKSTYQPMVEYFDNLGMSGRIHYIKVSDYNTTGMSYEKDNTELPFYAFVRAAGVSSKNDKTAGGAFGYGKAAYFYISPIRTVLVSTKTQSGDNFFEGVSSLCTHIKHGVAGKLVSVGYYDNNNGEPVSDYTRIPSRFRRDDSGTDIFILGIDASDREAIFKEMKMAVLVNFWMAIYSNRLEVKIGDMLINSENIVNLMVEAFPDKLDNAPREKDHNPRPYLDAVVNKGVDNHHIYIERNIPVVGKVSFYALKNKQAIDRIVYMRSPYMLVKTKRTKSSNGFFGVFICEDERGNEILRKTENPAHNEWAASNWRVNGKRVSEGAKAIKEIETFIIDVMEEMFSSKNKEVQNIQGLEDFLYIPTAIDEYSDESESLIGDVVDQRDDEGNALSTDLAELESKPVSDTTSVGKVLIESSTDGGDRNSSGGVLSGHGTRKKKTRGGGGVTSRDIDSRFEEGGTSTEGTFLTEVPVRYRAFAQMEGSRVSHTIIIHSDYEFSNGRIDLLVGGEQSNDSVAIKSCSAGGQIHNNSISGLHIFKGKNIITVKFADNMKHAIKLDTYELK